MSNLMLVEKVKELPDEYVDAVAAYIDKLMSRKNLHAELRPSTQMSI